MYLNIATEYGGVKMRQRRTTRARVCVRYLFDRGNERKEAKRRRATHVFWREMERKKEKIKIRCTKHQSCRKYTHGVIDVRCITKQHDLQLLSVVGEEEGGDEEK